MSTQPAFTCSKLTIETLEQGVKYIQSKQQRYQNDANDVVLVSLLLTLNSVTIVKYVLAGWVQMDICRLLMVIFVARFAVIIIIVIVSSDV